MNHDTGVRQRPQSFRVDRSHPLAKGLVFAALGRTPGAVGLYDESLSGNNGTLTNMTPSSDWVYSPDLGRWVLDFDGTNDYVRLRSAISLTFGTAWTIGFWANISSADTTDHSLIGNGDAYSRLQTISNIYAIYNDANNGQNFGPPVRDRWVFHTLGGNGQFRTDAALEGTFTKGGSFVFRDIGRGYTSYYAQGRIGDVACWMRNLLVPEIVLLADRANVMWSGMLKTRRRVFYSMPSGGGVDYIKTIDDTVGMVDTLDPVSTFVRTFDDGVGMVDTQDKISEFVRVQDDGVGIVDEQAKVSEFVRTQDDTEGITDTPETASTFERTVDDVVGSVDAVDKVSEFVRTQDDGVGVTDEQAKVSTFERTIDDTERMTDEIDAWEGLLIRRTTEPPMRSH